MAQKSLYRGFILHQMYIVFKQYLIAAAEQGEK